MMPSSGARKPSGSSRSAALLPQLAQLDDLDLQVGELEAAIEQLDAYSRRLEARFESLV